MDTLVVVVVSLLLRLTAVAAGLKVQPKVVLVSNTQPVDWGYVIPADQAITWFAAEQIWPLNTTVAFDSFVTNSGGQIVDIIRDSGEGSNDIITIRGYVPSADPYETNSTLVQISSKSCALQPSCTASMNVSVAPQCSIYPVDMSYCGSEGLVTDRGDAMVVVGCSTAVSGLCYPDMKGCTFVDGPANATINYVSEVAVSESVFYHIQVSWEPSYLGPVILSIDCKLADVEGNGLGVPMKALKFQVRDHVAVRATAYKIGDHQLGNI